MKKATYTLTVYYDNGDKSRRGGLTQTRAYEILKRHQSNGWKTRFTVGAESIVNWELTTGKKEIEF